jgi:hypothetical protein
MSVTDDLLGGSSYKPTAPAPQETYRGSVTDEFLSISPRAGTETFKSLTDPVAIADPRMSAGAGTAFMGGIPTDKQSAIKYFAQKRGIPATRYRVIDGNIAYQAEDGKFYKEIVTPLETAGYYAPDVLEAVPEVATGIATAPLSPAAAIPATMGVAGGSNYLRQLIGQQLTGTPVDPLQIGISAGTAGIAEAVPFSVKALRERKTVRDIAGLDAQAMKDIQSKARSYGISLTPAEVTQLNSLMQQQKVLGNVPDSSKKLQQFYEFREGEQIQPAVEKFLADISGVGEQTQAGKLGFDALKAREAQLKDAREMASDPLYKESFAEAQPVDIKGVVNTINSQLKSVPSTGSQAKALSRMKSYLYKVQPQDLSTAEIKDLSKTLKESGLNDAEITSRIDTIKNGVLEDRLENLQNAKFEMDALFNEDAFSSLDKNIQRKLTNVQQSLVDQMGANNPKYLEANRVFSEASKPIEEFSQRKTGTSLTQISPDNLNQFASRVFSGNDPKTIKYVKEQIEATNPEAWQAVTRAYIQDVWEKSLTPAKSQKGMKLDVGSDFQNLLLGSRKQQDSLRAALGDDSFMALRDLSAVLRAAGSVKKLGSDTAFNQQILKEMTREAELDPVGIFAKIVGTGISPQDWGKRINEWATERAFAQNADKVADIITSPQGMQQLKELRKMSPTSAKYWAGMSQLLTNYGLIELKD